MAAIAIVNSILISLVLISLLSLVAAFIVLKKFKKKEQTPEANTTKPELTAIKELERKLEKITENQGSGKDELKELLNRSTKEAIARKAELERTINQSKSELNKLLNQSIKGNTELKGELNMVIKRGDDLMKDFKKLDELFSKGTQHTGAMAELIGRKMIKRIGGIDYQTNNKYLTFSYQEVFKTVDGKEVKPDLTIRGNDKKRPTTFLDVKWPRDVYQDYLKDPNNEKNKKEFINSLKRDVKSISNKYLERVVFKAKFAILLVPSDGLLEEAMNLGQVYGVAKNSKEQMTYSEFCFDNNVVPTSPATLIAVISTLERYYELFNDLAGQLKNIELIKKWFKGKDNINEKLKMIVNWCNKILKKAEEIEGQMKLNCKTVAELPSPAE